MNTEQVEQLTRISHLLEGAGSDDAVITLNGRDMQILGIDPASREQITVTRETVTAGDDRKPVVKKQEVKIPAVQRDENPAVKSCHVNVGFARKALETILDGQRLDDPNRVRPEPVSKPEPEPAAT